MIMIAVKEDGISAFLKRNSIFDKFRCNFLNLAKDRLLPKINNPELSIQDYPVFNLPANNSGNCNDYVEIKFTYSGDSYNEDTLQKMCSKVADEFLTFLGMFIMTAIGHMMSHSEFIPLKGYSFENLKKESTDALKANRRFILIKDYDQYKSINPQTGTCKFDIKIIDPEENKNEYAEIYCILQKSPKEAQKELIKKYSNQLKEDDWTRLS